MPQPDSPVHRYHDGTKHHFNRFAPSLGYLDWATQPRPFRSFVGADRYSLYPAPAAGADTPAPRRVTYDALFRTVADSEPLSAVAVGDLLRHSLGLSAWKVYGSSRWSLRVNPSSGNLHPTEAYIVCGPLPGLAPAAAVYHYAPEHHVLEQRCAFDAAAWTGAIGREPVLLVAFTSIHWRESWKYGERAFRYCQHDLGHAIAAVSLAAAALGWRARLLPAWAQRAIAALVGADRDEDFVDAEREEPGCLMALGVNAVPLSIAEPQGLLDAVRRGRWSGRATQLSEHHVQWTFIDDVATATADPGRLWPSPSNISSLPSSTGLPGASARSAAAGDARRLFLQRRSAVAFDGISGIDADTFFGVLGRAMPTAQSPAETLWWTPRVHLLLFVHRVRGVAPGLYLLGRDPRGFDRLQQAIPQYDERDPAHGTLPLICLGRGDCRSLSRRLSCDQEIASDGCFSLGMIAEFDRSLEEHGPSFYRHLFWECGAIGQILYLEAEAAGIRATGIGCFYDDPVHDVLGLRDHAFQSLYHFTVGHPVEDRRLTTEPGYPWSG